MSSSISERFFLFDLDGTITSKEILPEIAREIGIESEMAILTAQAITGAVPYHENLTQRVELLKSASNRRIREIIAEVPIHEEIVEFIGERHDRCLIVTANLDVWVRDLCRRLGVRAFTSSASEFEDHIVTLDTILDKRSIARAFKNVVAIGDGHNDAGMLEEAEIGIACGIVHQPAHSLMTVATHTVYDENILCRFLRQL